MSEKGIYKKANGPGWDYDPDNKRAKERRMFAFWVWRVILGVCN